MKLILGLTIGLVPLLGFFVGHSLGRGQGMKEMKKVAMNYVPKKDHDQLKVV